MAINNVKLIIGSHGAGKSDWIYNRFILNSRKKDSNVVDLTKKFYLVVPEQDTSEKQKLMMKKSESIGFGAGIINIDVVSFDRIAHHVFSILNIEPEEENIVQDDVKTMMLSLILSKLNKEGKIKYYSKMINKVGFSKKLTQVVSEFYSYNITNDDIDKVINASDKDYIVDKLNDLKLVYEEFKKELKIKNFSIKEDKYNLLAKNISKVDIFKDAYVAFDGFTGFTPIQLDIFKKIAKVAKEVYVTIDMRDCERIKTEQKIELIDVFYLSRKFANDISKALATINIELPFDNYIFLNKPVNKYEGKEDLAKIENEIFKYEKNVNKISANNIEIYEAKNINEEVLNATQIIFSYVRNENKKYLYNDIKIVVPSIDDYKDIIMKTFNREGIPYFIDDSTSILNSPYIETIRSAIDVVNYDFSYDSVMRYISAGLIEKDNLINILDNLIRKYGIRGYKRFKEGFDKIYIDDKYKDRLLAKKDEIFEPLFNLYNGIRKKTNIPTFVKFLKEFMLDIDIDNKFNKFIDEHNKHTKNDNDFKKQQGILTASFEVTNKVLNDIYVVNSDNNDKYDINDFKKLLDVGFNEKNVKSIPFSLDQVVIGDLMRSRFDNPKIQILLGMNYSKVPAKLNDNSIIDDNMRIAFEKEKVELSQTAIETALNQRFYLYLAFTNPTEKLILSYSRLNAEEISDSVSTVVLSIMDMFDNLKPHKVDVDKFNLYSRNMIVEYVSRNIYELKNILFNKKYGNNIKITNDTYEKLLSTKMAIDYLIGVSDDRIGNILNAKHNISIKNLNEKIRNELYKEKNFNGSATKIESYNKCPYKYFLESIVKLNIREEYGISNMDIGNFLHKIMERVFDDGFDIKKASYEEIELRVDEIMDEIANGNIDNLRIFFNLNNKDKKYIGSNKIVYIVGKVRAMAISSLKVLKEVAKDSKLEKYKTESKFKFHIDNNIIVGRIDSIEKYEDDNGLYVNIVDYKTSKQELSIKDIEAGVKIQLILYLDYCINDKFESKKDVISCGAFYFALANPIISIKNINEVENIEMAREKEMGYVGIANDSPDIVKIINDKLEPDKEKYSNKNGFGITGILMNDDKMKETIGMVHKKIDETIQNIELGVIDVKPYKNNICNYCPYTNICRKEYVVKDNSVENNGD